MDESPSGYRSPLEECAMNVIRNRVENGTIDENPDVAEMALCMMTQDELDQWIKSKT